MAIGQGLALVLLAGVTMGGNLVPMKWMKAYKWENFWLIYSIMALVVVPLALAFIMLPRIGSVYASLSLKTMFLPFLYGLTWGIAQLGAGICVHRIGLGLTGSILNGICAAGGAFIPLCGKHPELLLRKSGLLIILGTAVMAIGLAFCGWAGRERERATGQLQSAGSGYVAILLLAMVSGFMASFLNVALAYGGEIVTKAQQAGAAPQWAPFAVWPIALAGGFLTNVFYCFYKFSRNHTWTNFGGGPREAFNPLLAGALWMIATAIYTSGATFLGTLGLSAGWALFQIALILTGNVAGLLTGEWKQMPAKISRVNIQGVAVLFLAVVIIAAANFSG